MQAYRGLFQRRPMAAVGMGIAMFSLVGIGFTPPTIGFMGKFYIFKEAVQHGFALVAITAVLASVISAFYYLSLVKTMFMDKVDGTEKVELIGDAPKPATTAKAAGVVITRAVLVASCVLIFVFGIFPKLFLGIGFDF